MEQGHRQAMPGRAQRGATAIEFALVFPLLFGVFWAIISYALPFFLYQVMNYAVAEASRDSVRYETVASNDPNVLATLDNRLSVLPQRFRDSLTRTVTYNPTQALGGLYVDTLTVTLTYPGCRAGATAGCITPVLNLFGASLPNLGPYTASTTIRLNRVSAPTP